MFITLFDAIYLLNIFINNSNLIIDIKQLIFSIIDDPLSKDWIILMLFTTLIPTLIHLLIAISGAFIKLSPKSKKDEMLYILKNYENSTKSSMSEIKRVAKYFTTINLLNKFFYHY